VKTLSEPSSIRTGMAASRHSFGWARIRLASLLTLMYLYACSSWRIALATAAFPPVNGYPGLDDESILKVFSEIQQVVRAVRELRLACNVSPKETLTATVVLPEAECKAFEAHTHIVLQMANVKDLVVDPEAKRPPNAGSVAMGSLRVFVHDISDDAAERARTAKALKALEKQIAGKEAKVGNESFIANAKPEIVEAERRRLAELVTQRDGLQRHLAELGGEE